MTHSTQQKVLAIIGSCYTPAHIEAAARMLGGIKAPKEVVDALQMRRVEIIASIADRVGDKLQEAESNLFKAQWCLTVAAQAGNAQSMATWAANVKKCRKEVEYWNQYFETTEA